MDKFYRLENYLKSKTDDSFTLTFKEVEMILGFRLSPSAYNYHAYWSPSKTHTLPNMILECGYKVSPNLKERVISFYKAGSIFKCNNNIDLKDLLEEFWNYLRVNKIDIYNEFSFQHELGIYLRYRLPNYKIQFERNISFFFKNPVNTTKKEIDIVIYTSDFCEKYAIELKYPRNGQHPEQMFSFIKDIKFMEELKELGFNRTFTMTLVDDYLFYEGNDHSGIYSFFRDNKMIQGLITKPTGRKDERIILEGQYNIEWRRLDNNLRYYLLEL